MLDRGVLRELAIDLVIALGMALILIGLLIGIRPVIFQPGSAPEVDRPVHISDKYLSLEYPRLTAAADQIEVVIPPGSSGLTVTNILTERGLVDAEDFQKMLSMFELQGSIRAGKYLFGAESTIVDILEKIIIRR